MMQTLEKEAALEMLMRLAQEHGSFGCRLIWFK